MAAIGRAACVAVGQCLEASGDSELYMTNRFLLFVPLALVLSTPTWGCFTPVAEGPPLGYETDEIACSDRRDNDRDGFVDCEDPDCLVTNHCARIIPLVPPNEQEDDLRTCTDRIDNDGDGNFDCGDRGCQAIAELCCGREFTNELCSDGIDNDGNGFADCADFGCRNGAYVTVCEGTVVVPTELCVNGVDDDDDGLVDCADPDCRLDGGCLGEDDCSNGIDDDMDGFTDCLDSECIREPACRGPEDTVAKCSDGVDNDLNGFTDCEDFSCSRDNPETMAFCAERSEDTVERCSDSIDNDGNGFTDCEDFSCSRSMDPEILALCEVPMGDLEDTLERCSDGIDNDNNGFIDCADFSCSRSLDPAVAMLCAASAENTLERCTDGIDNDGNGYTDCEDNSCLREGLALTEEERMLRDICEASFDVCKDGIDNEGDGFPDCADFSCRGVIEYLGPLEVRAPCSETGLRPGRSIPVEVLAAWSMADPMVRSMSEDEIYIATLVGNCTDGEDNDQDGFIDCDDWDCNWHPTLRGLCETERGNLVCE
jgi:hypothetical protein